MNTRPTRRTMLKTAGLAALAMPARGVSSLEAAAGPRGDLPKICLEAGLGGAAPGASADEAASAAARRVKQLGVDHVISGGGRIPWGGGRLKEMIDRLKSKRPTLANLMIARVPHPIYNPPWEDA